MSKIMERGVRWLPALSAVVAFMGAFPASKKW